MNLYHGTSEIIAKKSLREGLRPRSRHRQQGNWQHIQNQGNPNVVYLTTTYGMYFAVQSGNVDANVSERIAIIEIDSEKLSQRRLVPDEDALALLLRNRDGLPVEWSMDERAHNYARRLKDYAGKAEISLSTLGTCAHMGTIPVRAITRIAFIDYKLAAVPCFMGSDAIISLQNFRLKGIEHRAIMCWAFGDPIPEPANELERFLCADNIEKLRAIERVGIEVNVNEAGNG